MNYFSNLKLLNSGKYVCDIQNGYDKTSISLFDNQGNQVRYVYEAEIMSPRPYKDSTSLVGF